jgi:acetylornithine/N-succinyldiaminopimelate aminotransferase
LFKLARKFGHDEGRFEILTATNSFHGRTLAGIAATGQDKVKKGFEPMTPASGTFRSTIWPRRANAISPATVAIMIEGVQGEGGVTPATPEYLLGLRALCDEKKLLLLMDGVQCGHFRTGKFQSFQRILENSRRRKISARRPFDGQVARRRISHRRVLGARAVRGFAGAGHARHDVRRHAAGLRRRAENF